MDQVLLDKEPPATTTGTLWAAAALAWKPHHLEGGSSSQEHSLTTTQDLCSKPHANGTSQGILTTGSRTMQ